jgi:hypothetical protein
MKWFSTLGSVVGLAAALAAPSAGAQVSGAIFTTIFNSAEVDFNIYAAKEDVYLNGGPGKGAGSAARGLVPDGLYVFMVTSPDGQTLLSTDPAACRQVLVTGGIVVGTVLDARCPTAHLNGTSLPGGTPVQLMPYNDTPNPGGEYKAWLTPLGSYQCSGDMSIVDCPEAKHGFISSESKTDNFKVNSVADEIDTRFHYQGMLLEGRMVTWYDTHGASNNKWTHWDYARGRMHEAHVEAPEIGAHYIKIADQPGCQIDDVSINTVRTKTRGPQTVLVRVTKAMKNKGTFTVFIDVGCRSIN